MAYQFKKEPLRAEEADRLANACTTPDQRLVLWTLLDTGLRVSELCSITGESVRALRESYIALNQKSFAGPTAVHITEGNGTSGVLTKQRVGVA